MLREELRAYLELQVDKVVDKFDILCKNRVDSRGKQKLDPTIYIGSGGVALCLFHYTNMLRWETPKGKANPRLDKIEAMLEKAVISNIEAVDKVVGKKRKED